jgi:5-methylcytosine-specific restriction endonuclease McrA
MPYYLTTDTFADDPEWTVLAEGKQTVIDALQASYHRLMAKASLVRHDGYLTAAATRQAVTSKRVLALLTMPVLGMQPKLHKPGDKCECLGDTWIAGFEYRLHEFLKRNPSRKENDRNKGQKADLRNGKLKALVYERDGGCCRYCRSGLLLPKAGRSRDRRKVLTYDHVDPDLVAGADGINLVVACGRCNEHKGHRTPGEADMVLLPEPTEAEKAAWRARGQALFDLPDHQPINDETATDHQLAGDHVADANSDPQRDPQPGTDDHTTVNDALEQAQHEHQQPGTGAAEGPGWVGQPRSSAPRASPLDTQPARDSSSPDIYHRGTRSTPTPITPPPAAPRQEGPP